MSKKLFLLVLVLGLASGSALADPNLVGHWKMDTGSGTTATDSAGSGYHGTLDGQTTGPTWVNDAERGWCLQFNGLYANADHVSVPVGAFSTISKQMTVAVWAYIDPIQENAWGNVYRAQGGSGGQGAPYTAAYIAGDSGFDQVTFRAPQSNETQSYVTDTNETHGVWSHWAFTKNANNGDLTVYLNGVVFDSATSMTASVAGSLVWEFHIGSEIANNLDDQIGLNGCGLGDGIDGFTGLLSDFRLYDRELTLQQVRVIAIGPYAYAPAPANGGTEVDSGDTLSWSPGVFVQDVNGHVLYLGTNETDVTDANESNKLGVWIDPCEVVADGNRFSYTLGSIPADTTYYWRVDEVNDGEANSPWKGKVWSFATIDFTVVDDFEDYNLGNDRIFYVWVDGWTESSPTNNGAYAQLSTDIDPNGPAYDTQSLLYNYSSDGNFPDGGGFKSDVNYSEIDANAADLGAGTDWTAGGANKAIAISFYGTANNDANETMYFGLKDGDGNYAEVRYGDVAGEDMNDIREESWHQWDIDLNDFIVADVNVADVDKVYLGFDDSVKASRGSTIGGQGVVYFDNIRLYKQRCILAKMTIIGNLNGDCIIDYGDVKALADKWLIDGTATAPTIWEETMDTDPNDGAGWRTRPGPEDSNYTIGSGLMTWPDGDGSLENWGVLDTAPDSSFNGTTIVDVNWRATETDGNGIGVWVNAGNDDASGTINEVAIRAFLEGGVQRIEILAGGGSYQEVATGLGIGMLTGHFEIDDVNNSMTYSIDDGVLDPCTGILVLTPGTPNNSNQYASIFSRHYCGGEFDYIKIVSANPAFTIDEDLTDDNKINFDDFAVLADKWYESQMYPISP